MFKFVIAFQGLVILMLASFLATFKLTLVVQYVFESLSKLAV